MKTEEISKTIGGYDKTNLRILMKPFYKNFEKNFGKTFRGSIRVIL